MGVEPPGPEREQPDKQRDDAERADVRRRRAENVADVNQAKDAHPRYERPAADTVARPEWQKHFDATGTAKNNLRASMYFYNTEDEVEALARVVERVVRDPLAHMDDE